MKNMWSSLVDLWTVIAVVLSQAATAEQRSDIGRTSVRTCNECVASSPRTDVTSGTASSVASTSTTTTSTSTAAATAADVTVTEVRGSCWLKTEPMGRCSGLYALNVTQAECCALRPGSRFISYATGWTPILNMTSRQYFYWILVGQGVPGCQPCRFSCDGFECGDSGSDKVCRMRHGQPRCVCAADCHTLLHGARGHRHRRNATTSTTATWHGPVCSFDGRTHRSLCALAKSNCRSGRKLPVDYTGPCQNSCENVTCPGSKHCAHDQYGVPHCIHCRSRCRSSSRSPQLMVCGGDGQTYSSLCSLERHTCLSGRPIRLAYRGHCRPGLTCSDLRCGDGDHCLMNVTSQTPICFPCDRSCVSAGWRYSGRAICGSDGSTYRSRCELDRAACQRGVVIDASHAGRCHNTGEADVNVTERDDK